MNKLHILFVEDMQDDVELSLLELNRENFEFDWERVETEEHMRIALRKRMPAIIVSDYTMPAFNGLTALEVAKEEAPDIPFIFVSGTIGEERAIDAIQRGATDYVLKENLRRLGPSVSKALSQAVERRKALETEKERSRLVSILEATPDLVAIVNTDFTIRYLNSGGQRLLGLPDKSLSLTIQDLHTASNWEEIQHGLKTAVLEKGVWSYEAELKSSDGECITVSQLIIPHKDENDNVEFYSFIARDIRDRKEYEKQIQYLANFDLLTGLPNRSLLADRTEQALNFCKKGKESLAILVIDIDRFKMVNDGYGQGVGDKLLNLFAGRLSNLMKTGTTIARLSADCFGVLITNLSTPDEVVTYIGKILNILKGDFQIDNHSISIDVGIGVSVYPKDGVSFSTLLQNAEAAMHRAKENSEGSRFHFYTGEMTLQAASKVRIENELRSAVSKGELELYYQPQINIATRKVSGFEALMRWNHPVRGVVFPDEFIPIAEKSELITLMGEWALIKACAQASAWSCQGKEIRVSVNVSARQFCTDKFISLLKMILKDTGLKPELLELELTESALLHDRDQSVRVLTGLNDLGVSIALDDFGTGYSNLSYLSRLPLHCLKIDKIFVQRCLADNNDAEIVRAIISMADAMKLKVVAEGVECEEHLRFLADLACDEAQGFLFSTPLIADAATEFLDEYN